MINDDSENVIQEEEPLTPTQEEQILEPVAYEADEINQTLSDWVLGTEYGIKEAIADLEALSVELTISEDDYNKLQDYDFTDIQNSIMDILSAHGINDEYEIVFSNGKALKAEVSKEAESAAETEKSAEQPEETESVYNDETVNLIFIHHSVGENWLNAGLNQMLNDNNIHVADTYYGWRQMGDRTDTSDWPDWFNDDFMPTVYN
jgi:hypothetical protein